MTMIHKSVSRGSRHRQRGVFAGLVISVVLLACISARAADGGHVVVLREGTIGKSKWTAWLEPAIARGKANKVCRNLALSHPTYAGLIARSEFRECGSITAAEPAVESIEAGEGSKQRSVWLGLFAPMVRTIYVRIGSSAGHLVHLQALSVRAAAKVDAERLRYWVRGYAGASCLRRLITYDVNGEVLSDSGSEPC
jgi:hypothetical protein